MKRLLRRAWYASFPLRRPFQQRFEAYVRRCLATGPGLPEDLDLVLTDVVRELVHLQDRIETLQEALDEVLSERERLSVVGERRAC